MAAAHSGDAGSAGQEEDDTDDAQQQESASCIGQGLTSCLQVPELYRLHGLRSLCLHGNNISRIEGLGHLAGTLLDLNLSSNSLASLDGLAGLTALTSLNLASNKLLSLQGLPSLASLSSLNVSYNFLTSIAGLAALQAPAGRLRVLNLRHNQLGSLQAVSVLAGCVYLRELHVAGNPMCQLPSYAQAIVSVLPALAQLDGQAAADVMGAPFDVQAAQQYAAARLHAYEAPPTPYVLAPPAPAFAPVTASGGAQPLQPLLPPTHQQPAGSAASGSGGAAIPAVAAASHAPAASPVRAAQQPQHQPRPANRQAGGRRQRTAAGGGEAGGDSSDTPDPLQPPMATSPHSQPHPHRGEDAGDATPAPPSDLYPLPDQQHPASLPRNNPHPQQQQQQQPLRIKVFLTDAAAQTSEYTPLARRLQAEALELRQQLSRLTGGGGGGGGSLGRTAWGGRLMPYCRPH